jgi:hypothetical protein
MTEANVQAKILLDVSIYPNIRLFRNNVGVLKDERGAHVRYGVCNPGGSDLLGWTTKTITPDMVGTKVAIFTAVEVKGPKGQATEAQINFISRVKQAGGIATIARDSETVIKIAGLNTHP